MSQQTGAPELVAATECEIGENPLWHPEEQAVFYLDIARGQIWRYDWRSGAHQLFSTGRVTGGMVLNHDGKLLLFQDGHVAICDLDGKQTEVAAGLCPDNERFNDVMVDPEGRVYAGTIGGGPGWLMRFDLDGSHQILLRGIGVPNGMGFTPDLSGMYFTDSVPREVYRFDYDRGSGSITNKRVFATIPAEQGVPDGMAMDADGCVWTAVWFGGRVKRWSPDGSLEREVHLPVPQTSAPAFGGPQLDELYVTTAGTNAADDMAPPGFDGSQPRGGGLYRVRLGIRGADGWRAGIRW